MNKRFYLVLASFALVVAVGLTMNSLVKKKASIPKDAGEPQLFFPSALYNQARELESKEAYLDARALYKDILKRSPDEELIQKVQRDLLELNIKILFSPIITEDSLAYTVTENDTLGKIARRFNTTVELIMESNNLQSDIIRIGQILKISAARYSVVIDRSQNILVLKSDENVLKTYRVSTGINNSTPVGMFKIINKLKDPVWYKAGAIVPSGSPENILGSRWMGLSITSYGIHGTIEPGTIGEHITAGCVRMAEPDVQELYAILPAGTEVTIIE